MKKFTYQKNKKEEREGKRMRIYTHEELHDLMDGDPSLKTKSDKAHAVPRNNLEEYEQGKLAMMEIYAEAIGCGQMETAKKFVQEVYARARKGVPLKDFLDALSGEYISKKWCHAPAGNNYMCFCDEKINKD